MKLLLIIIWPIWFINIGLTPQSNHCFYLISAWKICTNSTIVFNTFFPVRIFDNCNTDVFHFQTISRKYIDLYKVKNFTKSLDLTNLYAKIYVYSWYWKSVFLFLFMYDNISFFYYNNKMLKLLYIIIHLNLIY